MFTIDAAQSYLQLAIPNFSYSSNITAHIAGENRFNGSPSGTAWSTLTGNQAFISGTMAADVQGSFTGKTVSAISFVAGSNNMVALASGNYRPNFAAYNSLTSSYNNNTAAAANYGADLQLNNADFALVSFRNTTLDISSSGALPASNTVTTGSIVAHTGLLSTGISSANLAVEGLSVFLIGQPIPNSAGTISSPLAVNTSSFAATYSYTSSTNLQITIPIQIPFSIDAGAGLFLNGTASGMYVANALVPEPSTCTLVGTAAAVVLLALRRRRTHR